MVVPPFQAGRLSLRQQTHRRSAATLIMHRLSCPLSTHSPEPTSWAGQHRQPQTPAQTKMAPLQVGRVPRRHTGVYVCCNHHAVAPEAHAQNAPKTPPKPSGLKNAGEALKPQVGRPGRGTEVMARVVGRRAGRGTCLGGRQTCNSNTGRFLGACDGFFPGERPCAREEFSCCPWLSPISRNIHVLFGWPISTLRDVCCTARMPSAVEHDDRYMYACF